jgi:serine/threonine protein kinase
MASKAHARCAVDARVRHAASSQSLPDDASVVGRLVANRYLIEEPCERTAASAIYRARHLVMDRSVLLRLLPERSRVTYEHCRSALSIAEQAAALPTSHVARTLDVGVVAERWPFVVSEYSRGQTLACWIDQRGPLALARALPIARVLASVLGMAHAAGVMHGELPPSGIWVESPSGRPEWVRLLDFGVRELPEHALETSRSGVFQSSAWRPPAGAPFSPDAVRLDLRALGTALRELTLGPNAAVRAGNVADLLDARFAGSGWGGERALMRGFAMIVERCLFPSPDGTYRSMDEASRDLETLAATAAALHRATPAPRSPAASPAHPPVTTIHAPARRARVALGGPKVIVRGG